MWYLEPPNPRRRLDWSPNGQHVSCVYVVRVGRLYWRERIPRENAVFLGAGPLLLPIFALWILRQTRRNKPALIPNSLWANVPFTAVCFSVFFI